MTIGINALKALKKELHDIEEIENLPMDEIEKQNIIRERMSGEKGTIEEYIQDLDILSNQLRMLQEKLKKIFMAK